MTTNKNNEHSYAGRRDSALSNLRSRQEVDPDMEIDETDGINTDEALEEQYADAFDNVEDVEDVLDEADVEDLEEAPTAPQKHKIKVNGVEREVTYEELVRKAQLVESAEEYQRQAKIAYDLAQQKLNEPSEQDVYSQASEEAELAEIAAAIQMGDTQEAVKALKKLRNKPSLSTDDVSRAVEQKLQFQKAVDDFKSEYSDLFEDEYLLNLVMQKDQALVSANDPRSYAERYESIGNEVREWRDSLLAKNGVQPKTKELTLQQKQERKSAAPQSYPGRKAATRQDASESYEDGEPSQQQRAASLAAKAKARGLVFTPKQSY